MYPYVIVKKIDEEKMLGRQCHAELVSASNSQTLKRVQGDVKTRLSLRLPPVQIELNSSFNAYPHLLQ